MRSQVNDSQIHDLKGHHDITHIFCISTSNLVFLHMKLISLNRWIRKVFKKVLTFKRKWGQKSMIHNNNIYIYISFEDIFRVWIVFLALLYIYLLILQWPLKLNPSKVQHVIVLMNRMIPIHLEKELER